MFYLMVVGTSDFSDESRFEEKIKLLLKDRDQVTIVTSDLMGTDSLARRYALDHGIKLRRFRADYRTYGRLAGDVRNREMHSYISQFPCRGCVIFWDGKSANSRQNISLCSEFGTRLVIYYTLADKFILPRAPCWGII